MKNIRKRVLMIVAAVGVMLTSFFPAQLAFADVKNPVPGQVRDAAELAAITMAMVRCAGDLREKGAETSQTIASQNPFRLLWDALFKSDEAWVGITNKEAASGDIFSAVSQFGDMYVDRAIGADTNIDGMFDCDANNGAIAKLFAQKVGVDYMDGLICREEDLVEERTDDDGNKLYISGGILAPLTKNADGNYYYNNLKDGCRGASVYFPYDGDSVKSYMKLLYNRYSETSGNPYIVPWDELNNIQANDSESRKAVLYYLALNDFTARCMGTSMTGSIDIVLDTQNDLRDGVYGKIGKDVNLSGSTDMFDTIFGFSMTCRNPSVTGKSLSDTIKTYAPSYSRILIQQLGVACKQSLLEEDNQKKILEKLNNYQSIINNSTLNGNTAAEVKEAQDYVNKWGRYTQLPASDFVEGPTEEGGYTCATDIGVDLVVSIDEGTKIPTDGTKSNCQTSGAAGSLGWIVCPILEWMGETAEGVYNDYVEPSLRIEPTLFNTEEGANNDVRDAWGTFQGIANIIFIILLLVVIFSQLTGVGIDNYGIKKILPKLIVAAILVNLSYFICIICADLSNILGNGLQSLFEGLGSGLQVAWGSAVSSAEAEELSKQVGSTALTAAPIFAILATGGLAIAWNPAILLTLLVSGIGVVVSIFFLFIILSARQAAIVVLTVISPVAFVLYILPNTKKLFDKWIKLWEGLLLVYPICGLLVGGGSYISKLLLSTGFTAGNFFNALSAMLIGIVPIFFIPTVLKGSFAAMGNLGAKISGIGQRVGGGLQRGTRNSNLYKRAQERGAERNSRIRAGLDANGNPRNLNRFQRLIRGGQKSVTRSRAQHERNMTEREKMYGDMFGSQLVPDVQNSLRSALAGNDAERATAAMDTLLAKGATSEVLEELSKANWGSMNGAVQNRIMRKMAASNVGAMKSYAKYRNSGGKADFKSWVTGTGSQIDDERSNGDIKDKTFGQALKENGVHAMDSYSKDEMKFVKDHSQDIANGIGMDTFGRMLGSAIVNSHDAKAQTAAEEIITKEMSRKGTTDKPRLKMENLGLTPEMIGAMRRESVIAIRNGEAGHNRASDPTKSQAYCEAQAESTMRATLASQIAAARSDSRIYNRTDNEVRRILGM